MARPFSAGSTRGVMAGRATFNADAWKKQVIDALMIGVRTAANKAHQSAVEDAPVREVFRKTGKKGGGLRRNLRTRRLSLAEANEEDAIRRRLGMAEAVPGYTRTRGRRVTNNPYLRRAASRRGNPNSFAPFMLSRGTTRKDVAEFREIQQELERAGKVRRGQKLDIEYEPPTMGGREMTRGGRLRHRRAQRSLSSRGRYEERSGRAAHTDASGVTTLGGRLRKEIRLVGPMLTGTTIRAMVVSPTPYAKFQEFGTRHNRATPYMRPAILKLTTSYRQEIVKALNRVSSSRGR